MKKTINSYMSKIVSLIFSIFFMLFLSACGTDADNQIQTLPEIEFEYNIIETDYNISDVNAPMMYFNCKFVLPHNFSYAPESESVLRLTNKESTSVNQNTILGEQMINFIDIHCNFKGDPHSDEAFIKDLFEGNIDAAKKYYINYNNTTVENANKFYSKEKYQLLNQNVDIQYYKSDENQKIAALSSELTVMQDSKDESTIIRTIYYYREDLAGTYVSVGTNEKIDPVEHYGIHIINSLKITEKLEFDK